MLFYLSKKFWWRADLPRSMKIMKLMVLTGVALSVATLVITLGVTAGFEREYKKSLLDFNAHIIIYPNETQAFSEKQVRAALDPETLGGVSLVSLKPFVYREALLVHKGIIRGVVLKGIPFDKTESHKPNEIILGKALADKLGLEGAKEVKILIPEGKEITAKNIKSFPVAGTFRTGLYEFDSQFAYIDLNELQALFNLSKSYHGFEIKLSDPQAAPRVAQELEIKLGPLSSIQDWVDLNRPLFQALELEKWVFRILIGLMVFVSALNLIGVILLAIFRKQKVIAILRALGLRSRQIQYLFSGQGLVSGCVGVFFGLLLGLAFMGALAHWHFIPIDPEIYFLERLPVAFDPLMLFIIAIFSLLLVWLVSWVAASRALTIPIREGLHGPGS